MTQITVRNALTASIVLWAITSATALAETKTVGVLVPLSGPLAKAGTAVKNAAILADEQVANQPDEIEFVFEDNVYSADGTVAAYDRLLAKVKPDALVVFGSGPTNAIAERIERAKIPAISISTAPEVSATRAYIMRHWLNPETEATLLGEEAARRGYQTIAIAQTAHDGLEAVRKVLAGMLGTKVIRVDKFPPPERNLQPFVDGVLKDNPSAVLLLLLPPQAGIAAAELRKSGYRGEFFGGHPTELDEQARTVNGALTGTWYASSDERTAQPFFAAYRKRFNEEPANGAANGFDIATLLIHALETTDANRYLHNVKDFRGAFGTYGAIAGNSFYIPGALKIISSEGPRYLSDSQIAQQ